MLTARGGHERSTAGHKNVSNKTITRAKSWWQRTRRNVLESGRQHEGCRSIYLFALGVRFRGDMISPASDFPSTRGRHGSNVWVSIGVSAPDPGGCSFRTAAQAPSFFFFFFFSPQRHLLNWMTVKVQTTEYLISLKVYSGPVLCCSVF